MTKTKLEMLLLGVALLQIILLATAWSQFSKLKLSDQARSSSVNSEKHSREFSQLTDNAVMHKDNLTIIVRDVLRSELRNALNEMRNIDERKMTGHGDSKSAKAEKPSTYEQMLASEKAADESRKVITQAVRAGVWTKEDSRNLYANLPDLTEKQRIQLLDQFHGAVNRQELELEDVPVL